MYISKYMAANLFAIFFFFWLTAFMGLPLRQVIHNFYFIFYEKRYINLISKIYYYVKKK